MAIITINDDWRIESDKYCWQVCRHRVWREKDSGERREAWPAETYHGTLESAIKSLSQRLLRASEAYELASLKADAEQIQALLQKAAATYQIEHANGTT